MTAILNLTDGVTTVTFVPASNYTLLKDGFDLSLPDVKRILGGDSLFREGERLVDRQYANRDITVAFKIEAADHDTLIADIRRIVRLLDTAKRTAREGFGLRVELHYKLNNATDEIVFDVLDGELDLGRISGTETHRASVLLGNSLKLLCRPFARLPAPIEISNWLKNPGFDWNPIESGRDAEKAIVFNGTTQALWGNGHGPGVVPSGAPPVMAVGMHVNWDTQQSAVVNLAHAGTTTKAWKLYINAVNKVVFEWVDTTPTTRSITSADALSAASEHFIAATMFTTDGSDIVAVLMIDNIVVATTRVASALAMRAAVGNFDVGGLYATGEYFDGRIAGVFVIKNKQVLPYQLTYLYRYGLESLYKESIMSPNYWGFEAADFGGVWPMLASDDSDEVTDQSGNGRDFGPFVPPKATNIRKPTAWTLGSIFASSTASGLKTGSTKHGLFGCHFERGAGASGFKIEQSPTLPADDWTVILWIKVASGLCDIAFDGAAGGIGSTGGQMKQYIKTFDSVAAGVRTLEIGREAGVTAIDFDIDSVMLCRGKPFGTFGSFTEVSGDPKPFIGSRFIRAWPDTDETSWLDLYDFPGDVPVTTRLYIRNEGTNPIAPLRIGSVFRREPWKQIFNWMVNTWIPDFGNSSDYQAGADPNIITASEDTIVDRFSVDLPTLYPSPADQFGSYKAYVGHEGEQDMISLCRWSTFNYKNFLTGDPVKDTNPASSSIHLVDCGILNWPPEIALRDFRAGMITSHQRQSNARSFPRLHVANASDAAIAAPNVEYKYFFLVPIDDGYFQLQMLSLDASVGFLGGTDDEILVVDTIDDDAFNIGYIAKEVVLPAGEKRLTMLASPELSLHGTGFRIPPNQPGVIVFLMASPTGSDNDIFGSYLEDQTAGVWLEYSPRFLYV